MNKKFKYLFIIYCNCAFAIMAAFSAENIDVVHIAIEKFQHGDIDEKIIRSKLERLVATTSESEQQERIILEALASFSKNIPKASDLILDFSDKALSLRLSPVNIAQVGVYRGNAYEAKAQIADGKPKTELLSKSLQAYIGSFKAISSSLKTNTHIPPPSVSKFDYAGDVSDPEYLALKKRHTEELAKRSYVDEQNALLASKEVVDSRIHEISKYLKLSPSARASLVESSNLTNAEKKELLLILSY